MIILLLSTVPVVFWTNPSGKKVRNTNAPYKEHENSVSQSLH